MLIFTANLTNIKHIDNFNVIFTAYLINFK